MQRIETPYKEYIFRQSIKAGLITAITRNSLYAVQGRYSLHSDLKRMGFLSRMIPFSYEYPLSKVWKVFEYIMGGKVDDEKVHVPKLKVVKNPKYYEPDVELFRPLQSVSMKLSEYSDAYGFRLQKNLQKLCYANAMLGGRDEVSEVDVEKVMFLADWMNFKFNPIR